MVQRDESYTLVSSATVSSQVSSDAKEVEVDDIPRQKLTSIEVELDLIPKLLLQEVLSEETENVEKGLTKLANLCFDLNNKKILIKMGGHAIIIAVLRKFVDNVKIQSEACRTILNTLDITNGEKVDENGAIIGLGGIEFVLNAMNNHPSDEFMQRIGCGALLNFSRQGKDIVSRIKKGNAFGTMVKAMNSFPKCSRLQMWACWAFHELGKTSPSLISTMIDVGAVSAIALAIENHRNDKDVQKFAALALKTLIGKEKTFHA